MARLSMNEVTTYRWSFEDDVLHYKAAGIPAMGVWRQKLSDYGEEKGVELLADAGLGVSNLLWVGGFTGSDGRSFREALDDAADAVRLAAALRAGSLIVYSGGRAGHTHNHARRLFCEALKTLAPLAREHGVTLAVEPMHAACAAEWTVFTSMDEALHLLDQVDASNVRLAFDTYHFGGDAGLLSRLPSLAPRIAVVHLADGPLAPESEQNRACLGDGQLPLAEIVAALQAGGYDGDYDVELIGEDIERADYHEVLRRCKAAFERLVTT